MKQPDLWPGQIYDMLEPGLVKFRIYPSLLDKYQQLLDYEEEAEKPWNKWTEKKVAEYMAAKADAKSPMPSCGPDPEVDDYILTPEQMYDKIEQELIDTINRVPSEPSEAADKGTCFNEVIDCLIENRPCSREDMEIQSLRVDGDPISVRTDYDGFTFNFDIGLCRTVSRWLKGSMCQVYLSAPIKTRYGHVELYGYADYWRADEIIDLKTTSKYDFGNYMRKWQRRVYPYCAVESGLATEVSKFTYLVAQLGKGKTITGHVYPETYGYDHEQGRKDIQAHLESFIRWLNSRKDRITDKKIFNQL